MMAALWCRIPLGGVIRGGVHGPRDQWTAFLVERCLSLHIAGGGYRRHGAVETRHPMRGDGLAQGDGAVWRRGGIHGS